MTDLYSAVSIPMARAAIGLSRIATIARPGRPRVRFHAPTSSSAPQNSTKKYRYWSASRNGTGESGLNTSMPCTPPVNSSKCSKRSSCGVATASAKVASARYSPSSRSAGRPNRNPPTKQIAPAGMMVQ